MEDKASHGRRHGRISSLSGLRDNFQSIRDRVTRNLQPSGDSASNLATTQEDNIENDDANNTEAIGLATTVGPSLITEVIQRSRIRGQLPRATSDYSLIRPIQRSQNPIASERFGFSKPLRSAAGANAPVSRLPRSVTTMNMRSNAANLLDSTHTSSGADGQANQSRQSQAHGNRTPDVADESGQGNSSNQVPPGRDRFSWFLAENMERHAIRTERFGQRANPPGPRRAVNVNGTEPPQPRRTPPPPPPPGLQPSFSGHTPVSSRRTGVARRSATRAREVTIARRTIGRQGGLPVYSGLSTPSQDEAVSDSAEQKCGIGSSDSSMESLFPVQGRAKQDAPGLDKAPGISAPSHSASFSASPIGSSTQVASIAAIQPLEPKTPVKAEAVGMSHTPTLPREPASEPTHDNDRNVFNSGPLSAPAHGHQTVAPPHMSLTPGEQVARSLANALAEPNEDEILSMASVTRITERQEKQWWAGRFMGLRDQLLTVELANNPPLIKRAADLARSRSTTPLGHPALDRSNRDHCRIEEIFSLLAMAASTPEAKDSLREFQHDRALAWDLKWLDPPGYAAAAAAAATEKASRRSSLLSRFLGARRASKGASSK